MFVSKKKGSKYTVKHGNIRHKNKNIIKIGRQQRWMRYGMLEFKIIKDPEMAWSVAIVQISQQRVSINKMNPCCTKR